MDDSLTKRRHAARKPTCRLSFGGPPLDITKGIINRRNRLGVNTA